MREHFNPLKKNGLSPSGKEKARRLNGLHFITVSNCTSGLFSLFATQREGNPERSEGKG
jgi:hypothetical protein